jgi:hypothetical protein
VEQLKDFIRKREFKVAKRYKDELMAIAYGAIQCGMKTRSWGKDLSLITRDVDA